VIDLSQGEEQVAAALKHACESVGFFYLAGHGVSEELMGRLFAANRALFGLPLEQKRAMTADANNRGWTPFREETLDPSVQTTGDTKEGFYFGRDIPADSPEASLPLHGPNQWPREELVPGYRATAEAYLAAMMALGARMLRVLALSLGLPPAHFERHFTSPMVFLRPLHYDATRSDPDAGVFGAGAHTDYGLLTFLATDEVPGLQIHAGGAWRDVAPRPGCLIVNLGDMLERWTNGRYRSTLHRVVTRGGQERYSVACFYEPNFTARVECLPCCCGPDAPPRYPPTTAGQHILDKYASTHAGYTGPLTADSSKGTA